MKRTTIVGLALALALLVAPLAVLAQDDDTEWEAYVSEDEKLTLSYPSGWFLSAAMEGDPTPTVGILSSEEAVTRFEENEDLVEGDKGFSVMVLPLGFLSLLGLELPEDASALDVAEALTGLLSQPEEGATDEEIAAMEVGEPEEVELGEDLTGVTLGFKDLGVEGEYVFRLLDDGLVALLISAAVPGEFDDEQRELGRQVAATVAYAGTGDELMAAMMGTPEVEEAPDDTSAADLDGEALVAERCTVCHTADRIDKADKDEIGWTSTVDRMIGYGAQLSSAERQAVIDYLVATH